MSKETLQKKVARAKTLVLMIEKFTADRKKLYEEHDELALELRNVPGLEAHGIHVADAFAKGNTQWGHGPVRRFSIEVLEELTAKPAPASSEPTRKRKASE